MFRTGDMLPFYRLRAVLFRLLVYTIENSVLYLRQRQQGNGVSTMKEYEKIGGADYIHNQVRVHRNEMLSLLRTDGRVPYKGTAKRNRYDLLAKEHDRLFGLWVQADQAERAHSVTA